MAKIGYWRSVSDDKGVPKAATITVYLAGTETKATIYTTAAGDVEKDNPFQTDVLGRFQFFAAAGAYDIQVSGTGITIYKIENVQLSDITASTQLTDMPGSLAGQAGKALVVNPGETAYEHSVSAGNHDLLSATHPDTTPAAAVRGDIPVAQGASPKWSRMAKGAEGQYVRYGADEPAPSLILAGDLPAHASRHESDGPDPVKLKVGFNAYLNSPQDDLIDDTWTTVLLDTKLFDLGGNVNLGTHAFIAPHDGYYLLTGSVCFKNVIADKAYGVQLLKNGAPPALVSASVANGAYLTMPIYQVTCFVYLEEDDSVVLQAITNCGADTVDLLNHVETTWFAGFLVSLA